jgi:hypothetical protein
LDRATSREGCRSPPASAAGRRPPVRHGCATLITSRYR